MGDARVTFDLRRGTIQVEGPAEDLTRLFEAVRVAAPALRQINVIANDGADKSKPEYVATSATQDPLSAMREFTRQFALENTAQRIAVLAYYAEVHGGKASFSVREMTNWFNACGFKRPAQMPYAMTDARRKYDYITSRGRDQWILTATGADFVTRLLATHVTDAPNGHYAA